MGSGRRRDGQLWLPCSGPICGTPEGLFCCESPPEGPPMDGGLAGDPGDVDGPGVVTPGALLPEPPAGGAPEVCADAATAMPAIRVSAVSILVVARCIGASSFEIGTQCAPTEHPSPSVILMVAWRSMATAASRMPGSSGAIERLSTPQNVRRS